MEKKGNALIRFNISEIQWLIIALELSIKTSQIFSNTDYENAFTKIKNDLIKVKENIIEDQNTKSSRP
tara:strand:+ start:191 stop:394 length:204 start_codon:yes stop_codon:yes gene_type:complete